MKKIKKIKKKKIKKQVKPSEYLKKNNDEIFKSQPQNEDLTKKEINQHSFTVLSDFGGGFCYHLDEGEEIKQEVRQQIPMRNLNNNDKVLVIESFNVDKESRKNPFIK